MPRQSIPIAFIGFFLETNYLRHYPWDFGSYTLAGVNPQDPSSYVSFSSSLNPTQRTRAEDILGALNIQDDNSWRALADRRTVIDTAQAAYAHISPGLVIRYHGFARIYLKDWAESSLALFVTTNVSNGNQERKYQLKEGGEVAFEGFRFVFQQCFGDAPIAIARALDPILYPYYRSMRANASERAAFKTLRSEVYSGLMMQLMSATCLIHCDLEVASTGT
ncbi:hypothetical protein BKA70DRAFT_1435703 [Coprinopsis sp. MPI-PUGE-AT-0042]|nr:hypothetical protein BKA70DRAFT_1435703 [Coprinopsis sp. MPI-PUGE-AT-0042]